jgi:precorrin-3B synthase
MTGLLARVGPAAILNAAGLEPVSEQEAPRGQAAPVAPRVLGLHDLRRVRALGVGAPFGRLDAQKLDMLADEAGTAGGELRLTPWRAVLIVGEKIDAALAARLRDAGFVLADDDPIRSVAACPGAPACANASTSTQDDARRLAPLARRLASRGVALHVSGCAKGCAHAKSAPVTAVARGGRYDLVLDGRAGDAPALRGMAVEQLGPLLQMLAVTPPAERAAALLAFQD